MAHTSSLALLSSSLQLNPLAVLVNGPVSYNKARAALHLTACIIVA